MVKERGEVLYWQGCQSLIFGNIKSVFEETIRMNFLEGGVELSGCQAFDDPMPPPVEIDPWNRRSIPVSVARGVDRIPSRNSKAFGIRAQRPSNPPWAPSFSASKAAPSEAPGHLHDLQNKTFNFAAVQLDKLDHFEEMLRIAKTPVVPKPSKLISRAPVLPPPIPLAAAGPPGLVKNIIISSKFSHQRGSPRTASDHPSARSPPRQSRTSSETRGPVPPTPPTRSCSPVPRRPRRLRRLGPGGRLNEDRRLNSRKHNQTRPSQHDPDQLPRPESRENFIEPFPDHLLPHLLPSSIDPSP